MTIPHRPQFRSPNGARSALLACVGLLAIAGVLAACRPRFELPAPQAAAGPVYSLEVRVRPADAALDVEGTLTLPADTVARDSLLVSVSERLAAFDLQLVQPAHSGPISVRRLPPPTGDRIEGERRSPRMVIRFHRPVPAGAQAVLRFSSTLSGSTAFLYHVGPGVAFASGWGDRWYPTVDGVYGLGTGPITVRVPPGWKVITGADAVGRPEEEAAGIFRFAQRLQTYFTFVAGPYTIVTSHENVGPRISAWVLTPRDHTPQFINGAARMVQVLENEFGPSPFGSMALVEVPRSIAQQAGFNAFSPLKFLVLNSNAFRHPDVKVMYEWLGHEMSHQWFPHVVTFDDRGVEYFEEALAEYGGIRIVEALAGTESVRRLRTTGFEFDPIYSAAAYFRLVGAGADEPLATMGTGINERNLAYTKGALVIDMLSREVGSERFRDVLRRLTAGRQLHSATWREFLDAIDAGAGRKMDWFFDQWLTRTGAPTFEMIWTQDSGVVRGTISQRAPFYRAGLRLDAHGARGERVSQVVDVNGASTAFTIDPPFRVVRVELDPDYEVLRWTPEFRALADSVSRAGRR